MNTTTVQSIDTGDTVRHSPSGEDWLVAYVAGGMLCACGWPCTLVPVSECALTEKATAEKRLELLQQLASGHGDDPRRSYAQRALAATQPNPAPGDAVAQTAPVLPVWWQWFLLNICELPDRNSPEDEPEAMVATPDELENCAIRAMERLAAPGDGQETAAHTPMFYASAEQANALQDRPDDNVGGVYLPLRKTAAGKFTMPLFAAPGAAIAAREQEAVQVPLKFFQGFCTLAHNYSLTAVPPDYYSGTERDAFSNAYRRCGQDLAKLRALISATPLASEGGA